MRIKISCIFIAFIFISLVSFALAKGGGGGGRGGGGRVSGGGKLFQKISGGNKVSSNSKGVSANSGGKKTVTASKVESSVNGRPYYRQTGGYYYGGVYYGYHTGPLATAYYGLPPPPCGALCVSLYITGVVFTSMVFVWAAARIILWLIRRKQKIDLNILPK